MEVDQLHSAEDNWVQIMEGPFRLGVSRREFFTGHSGFNLGSAGSPGLPASSGVASPAGLEVQAASVPR